MVRMGNYRILLDCGLTDLTPLLASARGMPPVDAVFCSHAHADHARGLLELHRLFPKLPIYASEATTQLLPLNWLDDSEVGASMGQALPWRSPVEFLPGFTVELFPAGHLPGAAALQLTYEGRDRSYTVFYSGDFLLSNARLVNGLPLEELRGLRPDVLIVEGTYGTARHPRRRQQENHLAELIDRAIAHQHSVLLPTATLGLGQELLMLLRSHHHFTGRDIDIWVDPMIAAGCDAYLSLLPHLPSSVQNFARHQPLFWDERVRPHVRRLLPNTNLSKALSSSKPCIVLSHREAALEPYLEASAFPWLLLLSHQPGEFDPTQSILSTGTARSPSLPTALQSGQLTLETYLLSEHCDGPSTTQLIHNLRPQHVVFFHGPPTYLADLTSLEELQNRYQLHTPSVGTLVDLPVGETFIQPAPPDNHYQGELLETETGVQIQLPETLMADPRWAQFADTGVVEARWQGEELVIRTVLQREVLNRNRDRLLPTDTECCQNCQYCRGQRCWNQASPLHGFRVSPEGYCPAFEAIAPYPPLDNSQTG
ncbi:MULTISPECIES: MBL fold metallo-hydrolase [unclassified Leptolyngbya]|uniref:MBL fold metallo-hydrolase n=1 Tax=unclassified Leptolyngbya TaxID=2650499 RepID=UPI0016874356|nr:MULTISPECIES: MBL fold metallo-hydrolase [unclassified Leptolyngbya]MBD1911389.1 MBL fold metallo-hydrolase [Leptolyngbya sp. FACHB-8]MBD2155185.1 MBL fold metallo-hydrolase [Leptolyngbya sp. FACHB-16]